MSPTIPKTRQGRDRSFETHYFVFPIVIFLVLVFPLSFYFPRFLYLLLFHKLSQTRQEKGKLIGARYFIFPIVIFVFSLPIVSTYPIFFIFLTSQTIPKLDKKGKVGLGHIISSFQSLFYVLSLPIVSTYPIFFLSYIPDYPKTRQARDREERSGPRKSSYFNPFPFLLLPIFPRPPFSFHYIPNYPKARQERDRGIGTHYGIFPIVVSGS